VLRNTSVNYDRLLKINSRCCLQLIYVRLQIETNKIHPFIQSSQATLYMYRKTARSKIQHHCGSQFWSIFIKVPFLCTYVTAGFHCGKTKGFKKFYTKSTVTELQCIKQFSISFDFILQNKIESDKRKRHITRQRARERGI
jgi:hypothetical protein